MEYDDEKELTRYVWDHFRERMTEFEQRVGWAHLAEGKAAIGHPDVADIILRWYGIADDPAAQAAQAEGVEAFCRRVCQRVLEEQGPAVFINRCPNCVRIVSTPQSRQGCWRQL